MLKTSQAIFAVRDVKEAVAFYRDVLGFTSHWFWGDPVSFGGAGWGDVHVMFHQQPHIAAHIEGHEHAFNADDIDGLHEKHCAAGANIVGPIGNKPWGIREYTVRDPNGYHLRFGGPTKYERPATATESMPTFIRIVPRRPTWEEYSAIQTDIGWGKSPQSYDIAGRSLMHFVAIDQRSERVIGTTRVMHDADGWYSIWDVAVMKDFQNQRIGSALMEAAVAAIKAVSPTAIIYLFTMKHGFYERLGFHTDTVTMKRL